MVTRQALQALDNLSKVSGKNRVAWNCRLPGGVQRPSRAGQMRRAADAASAWGDDQSGLRVFVAQDDFEAAKEFGLSPGIGDHAVFDLHADIEIAFHAANG